MTDSAPSSVAADGGAFIAHVMGYEFLIKDLRNGVAGLIDDAGTRPLLEEMLKIGKQKTLLAGGQAGFTQTVI